MSESELLSHYNDTFAQQKEYIAKRDRLTIILLLLVVVSGFLMSNPTTLTNVVNEYAKGQFSIEGDVFDFAFLNSGVSYLLLWFTLQYYQVCLTIEREYDYLWELEEELSKANIKVTREGKHYAKDYPLLKNVANVIYAWGIPIGVIVLSVVKAITEIVDTFDNVWIDCLGLALVTIVSVCYFSDRNLIWHYWKKSEHQGLSRWQRFQGFIRIDVEEENNNDNGAQS